MQKKNYHLLTKSSIFTDKNMRPHLLMSCGPTAGNLLILF